MSGKMLGLWWKEMKEMGAGRLDMVGLVAGWSFL